MSQQHETTEYRDWKNNADFTASICIHLQKSEEMLIGTLTSPSCDLGHKQLSQLIALRRPLLKRMSPSDTAISLPGR